MLFITLIVVGILLSGYLLMSTNQINHINRAAVAMISGVAVWVVLQFADSTHLKSAALTPYLLEAVQVILFLIASSTIVETMNNNGVFDELHLWMRTKNSKALLWDLSLLTFIISANVDNLTTVVLMLVIMNQIVRSAYQKRIYACSIFISAMLGGSFTVIGDMTSMMLWVHGVVTPTAFSLGLALPVLTSLVVFNLLMQKFLVGRVEVVSAMDAGNYKDSFLAPWQKILLLIVGLGGLWSVPTFAKLTHLPPFLGALSILAVVWVIDGIYNYRRNGRMFFKQKKSNTEFIGMRLILYFLGITIGVGALVECGALDFVGHWLSANIHNVYIYGGVIGVFSSVIDNIPFVMVGLLLFPVEAAGSLTEMAVDGSYWQLLSFCSALGGSLFFIGTLSGHTAAESENIPLSWYVTHISWRVLIAWAAGLLVFFLTH